MTKEEEILSDQSNSQPQKKDSEDKKKLEVITTQPASGRSAFRNVRKQLTEEEISNPGVQRLLLDILEETEKENNYLKSYVDNFHLADKKAAILEEKLNTLKAIEIFFGVGVGLGGTILGSAPYLAQNGFWYGLFASFIGLAMIIGSTFGRIVKL